MIHNSPAVLNFNRLFLKLHRFICKQLPVIPDHWDDGVASPVLGLLGLNKSPTLLGCVPMHRHEEPSKSSAVVVVVVVVVRSCDTWFNSPGTADGTY